MNIEMQVSPGIRKTESGLTVVTRRIIPYANITPGSTADHESRHAVVALRTGTWVIDATRKPGDGFSGRVRFTEFNALAFMASVDCDGNSHDQFVVGQVMGRDVNAAAAGARQVMAENWREILAVGRLIQAEGTVSGYRIKEEMDRAADPELEVLLIGFDGRPLVTKTKESWGNFVKFDLSGQTASLNPATQRLAMFY
jgi:hypothetical protein